MSTITASIYGVGVFGFLTLTILSLRTWRDHRIGTRLIVASTFSALWAAVLAINAWNGLPLWIIHTSEAARDVALIYVLIGVANKSAPALLSGCALLVCLLSLAIGCAWPWLDSRDLLPEPNELALARCGFVIAILALWLLERILGNSNVIDRKSLRYFAFGMGALFIADFSLYSQAELLKSFSASSWAMRGVVDLLAIPSIAVALYRGPRWLPGVCTRAAADRGAFRPVTLAAVGLYLLSMAAVGLYLRSIGGVWTYAVEFAFLLGAGLVMGVLALKGAKLSRSRARVRLWLRFFRRLASAAVSSPRAPWHATAVCLAIAAVGWWLRLEDDTQAREQMAVAALAEITTMTAGGTLLLQTMATLPIEPQPPCRFDAARGPEMVVIEGGSFLMGSPPGEAGRGDDEGPQHSVTVQSFALGRCEVTVEQFEQFVAATGYRTDAEDGHGCYALNTRGDDIQQRNEANWRKPGFSQADTHPVVCVSVVDAQNYIAWLNQHSGQAYRLPTEAEWEYAARAGYPGRFSFGDDLEATLQCKYANDADQSIRGEAFAKNYMLAKCDDGYVFTAPVAALKPNGVGLYSVHGNAWEWVEDCYHDSYSGAPNDGSAWLEEGKGDCSRHVLRGGSWNNNPRSLRSAVRYWGSGDVADFNVGFRLARTL